LGIESFLIPTDKTKFTTCPPNEGWTINSLGQCTQKRHAMNVPNVPIGELGSLKLVGTASPSGDGIILTVGKKMYAKKDDQSDGITDLSQHWQNVEFDIFGNASSSQAIFDPNTTITVNVQADAGVKTQPSTCKQGRSTTAESNNLSFVTAPSIPPKGTYPGMEFTESNAGGSTSEPLCKLFAAY
jgi:hypothetical protein